MDKQGDSYRKALTYSIVFNRKDMEFSDTIDTNAGTFSKHITPISMTDAQIDEELGGFIEKRDREVGMAEESTPQIGNESKARAETLLKIFKDSHTTKLAVNLVIGAVGIDDRKAQFWNDVLVELDTMDDGF